MGNPLILHISDLNQLDGLVLNISDNDRLCMNKFWPGPLTLIFKRSDLVPDIVTASLDTVAIRMPDHPVALELITRSKRPIAAPSANTSGRPSPTRAEHVYEDLNGKLELILDGGATGIGLESTVLDLTGSIPTILRPGAITREDLLEIFPEVNFDKSIVSLDKNIIPKSPGQKYKHYAPKGEMFVFKGEIKLVAKTIEKKAKEYVDKGYKVGIMVTDETKDMYNMENIYSLGSRKDELSIAHNLFSTLRLMDKKGIEIILSESVEFSHMGVAIMNRMLKASSGQIIDL